MPSQTWLVILVAVLLTTSTIAVRGWSNARAAAKVAAMHLETQRKLNDSTVAILVTETAHKDTLAGLLKAADLLQGKLIAGLKLHVSARDTAIAHNQLQTTVSVDSTRVATFSDSTFAGTIEGTVTAPPCCSPLALDYRIHRPAFEPSVGFVQTGNKQVATVVWQGETVRITAAFMDIPKAPKKFGVYLEGGWTPGGYVGRAGTFVRKPSWALSAYAAVGQYFEKGAEPAKLEAGLRKEF